MYHTDGEGRWWKQTWKPQCTSDVILWGRCQGTEGHADEHWSYSPCGSFNYAYPGAGGGSIPPGNKNWVSPVRKADEYHVNFVDTEEVTDPALIAQLEADELDDGSSVTRPCSEEEVAELDRMGRLTRTPEETAFHDRMKAKYGESDASEHKCAACGKQATEWSPQGWGCSDCFESH